MSPGLFQSLIGDEIWATLPAPVRDFHGDDRDLSARGDSIVDGSTKRLAALVRRVSGLPAPGSSAALDFQLHREHLLEHWTRRFATRTMRSIIDRSSRHDGCLRERLGPATLHFELVVENRAIVWRLRSMQVLGIGLPPSWLRGINARSSAEGERYRFETHATLPLIGLLVAYRGWLERHD
ncbi:uncharacterized protein DUF4166 [Luteibacter rhizovicinus]|uniref:Uncharacterized protein DUF4166 n=1 Tax=Luteibacter rhizovicinus TaxID=242606 RepID=A0A4R3YTE7_9GAMM|nr:DUF4166 domain-containing protein [Luteibacter rhizovicinus]TCV96207.1 uncharacterized protein DUF4166 [Luteibacter rhizovicinus]